MIKIDTSGLDRLRKKLENVHGKHEVSTDDLMTDSFIRSQTSFANWQEVMDVGGVESNEDIVSDNFSEFIRKQTKFDGFDDMAHAAGAEWVSKQLDL
jgi:hypothetical protein